MQVGKWGNSLAVRLPSAVVDALELKEGDDIEISVGTDRKFEVSRDRSREEAIAGIHALGLRLPPGYTFKRSDAYDE